MEPTASVDTAGGSLSMMARNASEKRGSSEGVATSGGTNSLTVSNLSATKDTSLGDEPAMIAPLEVRNVA